MMMHAPIGIFISTPGGRYVYVNLVLARMLGYDSPQEAMDSIENIGEQIYSDPEERGKILRWLEEHDERLNLECRFVRKDGSRFWGAYNVRAVRNDKGEIIYYEGFAWDISDRKQTEQSLLRTQFAMDRAPDSILWIDDEGRIVYANDSACASMGYEREELLKMKVFDIDPDFPPDQWEQHKKTVRKLGSLTFESRHRAKNGSTFPVEVSTNHFKFDDHYLACAFDRDITGRKRAEMALRESEEKYRGLVEGLHEALFRMSLPDGKYEYISPAAIHVLGYSAETCYANPLLVEKAAHPDYREFVKEALEKMIRGEVPPTLEYKIIDSEGKERWIFQSNKGIFDDGGNIIAVEGICRDITEGKRAEEALRESESRFRRFAEIAPAGIVILDRNGDPSYVSHKFLDLFGYQREDLSSMEAWWPLAYPDETLRNRVQREWQEAVESARKTRSEITPLEYPVTCRDGSVRLIEFRMAAAGDLDIVLFMDVTDRRRKEEERKNLEDRLRQARRLESVGTLAGGIAHEFNNLLMGIQGNASLMMLDLEPSHPHYERLKRIERQVQSGARLTSQLLGFARGGRYRSNPISMNVIIDKIASIFERTRKELTIHRRFSGDLWVVEADTSQMDQVFMNLFMNADEAMPGGGDIFLETENVLLDEMQAAPLDLSAGKYVRIAVSDTGKGMDAETLERIYEPFFTTKGTGKSAGLGLPAAYGIIRGHGGAIDVASEPGLGTTFRIYLPVAEKTVIEEKGARTEAVKGKETILIVDDEAIILEVTQGMLRSMGYQVFCAGSGREALDIYREKGGRIDLIVLDMIMPGMSGTETFERLRELDPNGKILLCSGYSIEGKAAKLIEKGCGGFIQKPFRMEDLSREVRTILDRKEESS
ncbi:MAG TPA: PAS domain S-box protein [Syntrophales bacterium]|nr:PAS domain S-box protein [Syntrophales bacterium]